MREIDLHVHTAASDGTLSPAQVVALAKEQGLTAIAVTDHDTAAGYAEAARAGQALGLEVVCGIEISTRYGGPVHILGYDIDPIQAQQSPLLASIAQDREERNRKMALRMAEDGLPISYEAMQQRFGTVIGRPHFGQLLIELGLVQSMDEAFDRYIEKGRKYYLPRSFLSIEESLELISRLGGRSVLAHPFQYRRSDEGLRELICHCMDYGLQGMECYYSGYGPEQCAQLTGLAREYGLRITGGSDFHGSNKAHIQLGSGCRGELAIPYALLQQLRQ